MDEFPLASVLRPRLTVAAQPIDEIGRRAVASLLGSIAQPKGTAYEPHAEFLPPTLLIGGSCRDLREGHGGSAAHSSPLR
jgi:LacI family transcriptional regulator